MNSGLHFRCTSPVQDYLTHVHDKLTNETSGQVATYIPELAKANSEWFGICLATTAGNVYEVGDSRQTFTIQSISKPFVYGLALENHGRAAVLEKVGVEPTGDAFNSISLDPGTGRPRNPMINAGAIASAGMVEGKTPAAKLKRLLDTFGLFAGRELGLDQAVYRSESETGHRNRAIGHMLRNFNILTEDPQSTVELYFQQCSISVNCRDLAVMAATLANSGINPITGKQALRGEYVESVLSVMGSCGMYDYAGEWIYSIGMPAKSGVAGGIIAVLPGQVGIGVFSPRLDSRGNSVRGIKVCDELSRGLDLHVLNRPSIGKVALRLKTTGSQLNSSRVRTPEEARVLRERGSCIHIYQLQGNLVFASLEPVVHALVENFEAIDFLVLDFKHVLSINESACHIFHQLLCKLCALNKPVVFVHADKLPALRRFMRVKLGVHYDELYRVFDDEDPALEICENLLLNKELENRTNDQRLGPASYELFDAFSSEQVKRLASLLKPRRYSSSEIIIHAGDEAREMFFLARGSASVYLVLPSGKRKRLATFSPGMAFGEMAILERAPRSAMIVADTDLECDVLGLEEFELLSVSCPEIKITLLQNLASGLSRKLRDAHRARQALS